jgi:uncharacterized protein YodC (DUF2158 family)
MTTFQPGNKVRHKSGTGYNMAVVEIDADNNVRCQGYSGKKWETGIFNPVTLEFEPDDGRDRSFTLANVDAMFGPHGPATETGKPDLAHLSEKQLIAAKKESPRHGRIPLRERRRSRTDQGHRTKDND